ncbi:hypothetical protein [Nocardia sp. NPDC003963]
MFVELDVETHAGGDHLRGVAEVLQQVGFVRTIDDCRVESIHGGEQRVADLRILRCIPLTPIIGGPDQPDIYAAVLVDGTLVDLVDPETDIVGAELAGFTVIEVRRVLLPSNRLHLREGEDRVEGSDEIGQWFLLDRCGVVPGLFIGRP